MELRYTFEFDDGPSLGFVLQLDGPALDLRGEWRSDPARAAALPDWTLLQQERCPHCPLDPAEHRRCPVAANLAEVVDAVRGELSYRDCLCTVTSDARSYSKRTGLFEGLSSLIGAVMASSGCPIMDRLRPMVFTHLPFANVSETLYRGISMYLLAQHLRRSEGLPAEDGLTGLLALYEDVSELNRAFMARLRRIEGLKDVSLNALVSLDCFAVFTSFSIVEDSLGELKELFRAHLAAG